MAPPPQVLAFTPLPALPETVLASLTPQQQLRVQQQAQHLARRMFRDPFQPVRAPNPTALHLRGKNCKPVQLQQPCACTRSMQLNCVKSSMAAQFISDMRS